jgi:hypothetical protein
LDLIRITPCERNSDKFSSPYKDKRVANVLIKQSKYKTGVTILFLVRVQLRKDGSKDFLITSRIT